ncbi:MAG: monoheme cytochrome C [Cytophagaceae bacterium]|nr:monoheme cytochrome C [Cytophagaceae bacterium]
MKKDVKMRKTTKGIISIVVLGILGVVVFLLFSEKEERPAPEDEYEFAVQEVDPAEIKDGIHTPTGLKNGDGLNIVINNCTNCHSAKLIMQNRMNAERWAKTIDWMQATQNLWDLGDNEEIIINYLVTNYPPERKGRRAALKDIEWYSLN